MSSEEYAKRRVQYVEYLKMKVETEDWHGVADAAMDLRELDAFYKGLTNVQ
jgi:hypothetical protein